MERQMSFSDVEYSSHRVTTKKEEFLGQMDSLVPWAEWCALIAPFWHPTHPGKRGRKGEISCKHLDNSLGVSSMLP